jgi:hypothetical protein
VSLSKFGVEMGSHEFDISDGRIEFSAGDAVEVSRLELGPVDKS